MFNFNSLSTRCKEFIKEVNRESEPYILDAGLFFNGTRTYTMKLGEAIHTLRPGLTRYSKVVLSELEFREGNLDVLYYRLANVVDGLKREAGITSKWIGSFLTSEVRSSAWYATFEITVAAEIISVDSLIHNQEFNDKLLEVINE